MKSGRCISGRAPSTSLWTTEKGKPPKGECGKQPVTERELSCNFTIFHKLSRINSTWVRFTGLRLARHLVIISRDFEPVRAGGVFPMQKFGSSFMSHITRISGLLAAAVMLMAVGAASSANALEPLNRPRGPALWVVNDDGNSVAEFTGNRLKTSGANDPTEVLASADLDEPWGLIFDSNKNLWVSNVGNGTLTKFTFKQLKGLKINSAPAAAVLIGGLDRPEGMAFDAQGNMWVANEGTGQLLEFNFFQLGSSGSPPPVTTITSADLDSPVGLAFDHAGNLWEADDGLDQVAMFSKAKLAAGGTQSASVILTSGSLNAPEPLIFDKSFNLWVGNDGDRSVVKFNKGQLGHSGAPTPAVTLSAVTVTATSAFSIDDPTGVAFDEGGDLWVGNPDSDEFGSVAKFSKRSIKTSGSPQPSVFIDSNSGATNLNAPFFLVFGPEVP